MKNTEKLNNVGTVSAWSQLIVLEWQIGKTRISKHLKRCIWWSKNHWFLPETEFPICKSNCYNIVKNKQISRFIMAFRWLFSWIEAGVVQAVELHQCGKLNTGKRVTNSDNIYCILKECDASWVGRLRRYFSAGSARWSTPIVWLHVPVSGVGRRLIDFVKRGTIKHSDVVPLDNFAQYRTSTIGSVSSACVDRSCILSLRSCK